MPDLNRKIVNTLLALFILFTLYNTLLPFDFHSEGDSLRSFLGAITWHSYLQRMKHTSLTDIAGNILLFIPFGFLTYIWFHQRRIGARLLLTGIVGLVLSFMIEVLQLFLRERISSITDLFNNTFGSLIGAVIALIYFRLFAGWAHHILKRLIREQPITVILLAR